MKNNEILREVEETVLRMPLNLQFFAENTDSDSDVEDSESDADESDEDTKDGKDSSNKKTEKTFTQSQVTRMMAREKKQGRSSVYNELGLDEKTAKADFEEFKKWKQSQLSEDEKKRAAEAENAQKIKEAEDRALRAEVKAVALQLGIKRELVDDVVLLSMTKITDTADIEPVLAEIKEKYKVFSNVDSDDENEDEKQKKGTGSPVKSSKGKKGQKEEIGSLGKRLAANKKTNSNENAHKSRFF